MLRTTVLRPLTSPVVGTTCQPLAPDIRSGYKDCAPKNCCDDCEPRVRLKDYILLKPAVEQSCFLIGEDTCDATVTPAHLTCFTAEISPRGECRTVLHMTPLRATTDGKVCFKWPPEFWALGDGRYEMEIKFSGCCSVVVGLDVRGCFQALLSVDHINADQCKPPPVCAPQIDDEPEVHVDTDCTVCQNT